ncbi:MAG: hypothetical protein GC136_11415 [Alphaproteobacteria bacterium]|nr:hypothetical protein [Alphaproteobacteria bacterium]
MTIKKITLDEAVKETIRSAPEPTILGKMAAEKGLFDTFPESKTISEEEQSINRLKALRKELKNDFTGIKSENPLDRSIKEIAEAAISELCLHYRRDTGHNVNWLNEVVRNNWKSGRTIKHDYEQRVRCCQLIYFLTKEDMSQRQAYTHADKIYGFNDRDGKNTYPYFLQNLQKYYSPEIEYKKYVSILIFMDIIQYGKLFILPAKNRNMKKRTKKAQDLFENIFQNSMELLKKEINYAQENKLEQKGVRIDPIIHEILSQNYFDTRNFIGSIQRDEKRKWKFVIGARNFIDDMDFYYSVQPK